MPASMSAAWYVIKIVNTFDVERDMVSCLKESEISARV